MPALHALTIRSCTHDDFEAIHAIVNDAAEAYRGVIPADCWHDPYMGRAELAAEIADGVAFRGCEEGGALVGVMGIQDRGEVTLVRHAYVRTLRRRSGIGGALLARYWRVPPRQVETSVVLASPRLCSRSPAPTGRRASSTSSTARRARRSTAR